METRSQTRKARNTTLCNRHERLNAGNFSFVNASAGTKYIVVKISADAFNLHIKIIKTICTITEGDGECTEKKISFFYFQRGENIGFEVFLILKLNEYLIIRFFPLGF